MWGITSPVLSSAGLPEALLPDKPGGSAAAAPSIEAIVHALVPFTFVDHTHADAILVLSDQPDGEALVREALGDAGVALPSRELVAAGLGLLPAAVALSGSELAAYHGVEHKAIAAYEQGGLDPAGVAKEHQRCGSNLIAPLIVFAIAGQTVLERLVERPGAPARGLASVVSLSLAVETFAFAERNPDSALGRAVRAGLRLGVGGARR